MARQRPRRRPSLMIRPLTSERDQISDFGLAIRNQTLVSEL